MICPLCDPAVALPGDPEMEKCVLSCMMQAPDFAVDAALQLLAPEHFSNEASALLFDIISRRHGNQEPVDPVSVTSYLYDRHMVEKVGGPAFVSECYIASPNPAHVKHYATAVLSASKRRQVARFAAEMARAAVQGGETDDWRDAVLPVLRKLDAVMMDGRGSDLIPLKEVAFKYADTFEAGMAEQLDAPVATGISGLDKLLDGGIRREHIIIGGFQGHGKSLLAMQFAGVLANAGRRGLIVGYEMTALQILMRDLARETGVPLNQVMGRVEVEGRPAFQAITRGVGRLAEHWKVYYIENPYCTLETVAAHARSLHRSGGLDFIVVDYLQLIPLLRVGKERSDEALVSMSNYLERLRKELGCTLIAPIQINKEGDPAGANGIKNAPQVYIRIEMTETTNGDGQSEAGDDGFLRFLKNRFGNSNRACPVFRNGPLQKFQDRQNEPPPPSEKSSRKFRKPYQP